MYSSVSRSSTVSILRSASSSTVNSFNKWELRLSP